MPASLLWLFPAAFLLHVVEEGLVGERFYRWIVRVSGRTMSGGAFAALNTLFLIAMIAAILLIPGPRQAWLATVLGSVALANGLGHLAGAALTRSYSPGVVTGTVLLLPLGSLSLVASFLSSPLPLLLEGLLAGALVAALVILLAFSASRQAPPV